MITQGAESQIHVYLYVYAFVHAYASSVHVHTSLCAGRVETSLSLHPRRLKTQKVIYDFFRQSEIFKNNITKRLLPTDPTMSQEPMQW